MTDPLLLPLAMASYATYTAGAIPTFVNQFSTSKCFKSIVNGVVTYAFEGTMNWQMWAADFSAVPVFPHPDFGPIHGGYWIAIGPIIDDIEKDLKALGNPPFYLCGHSLGGGEVIEVAAELKRRGLKALAVRAYEPPVVGSKVLWDYIADMDFLWTQTQNKQGHDIVTCVPPFPPFIQSAKVVELTVADEDSIPTKHRLPAVIAAIIALG